MRIGDRSEGEIFGPREGEPAPPAVSEPAAAFCVKEARRFQAGGGASGSPESCRWRLFIGLEGPSDERCEDRERD